MTWKEGTSVQKQDGVERRYLYTGKGWCGKTVPVNGNRMVWKDSTCIYGNRMVWKDGTSVGEEDGLASARPIVGVFQDLI